MAARLALSGIALYVAIDVALVFLRPQLSILHNAESDYGSHGAWAWLMDLNFLLRCALSLAVVWALTRAAEASGRLRLGLALLGVWAIASGLLAFFPDDPVGTAVRGSGRVHLALAFSAFIAVLIGAIRASRALRRQPGWQPVALRLTLLSWGALLPLLLLARAGFHGDTLGGLYEKVFLACELAWLGVVAARIAGPERECAPVQDAAVRVQA